jgi:two-component system, NarL family, response regulator
MKPENSKINVFIVDDHPIFRQGLAVTLARQEDLNVIAEASSGRTAVSIFESLQPDVTLMDLQMPEMHGVEVITQIRARHPAAKIIVLTTYDSDGDIRRALRAGASGYLLKDASAEELCESIRAVHRGSKRISPEVGAKLAELVNSDELSERELEVLQAMTEGHSNREIAAKLFISESTVKFHISAIFGKLKVNDRTQAVITALKRGITKL